MWIYLKNDWVLFILKMSVSRGSPCISKRHSLPAAVRTKSPLIFIYFTNKFPAANWNFASCRKDLTDLLYCMLLSHANKYIVPAVMSQFTTSSGNLGLPSSGQVLRYLVAFLHDHPSYLCCPDALSMVGDPLSGNGCGSPNHI